MEKFAPKKTETGNGKQSSTTATAATDTTQQGNITGAPPVGPEPGPELCCVCMSEEGLHYLQPCDRSNVCGTRTMVLHAGVVDGHSGPRCPTCRVVINDHSETPLPPPVETIFEVAPNPSPSNHRAEGVARVAANIGYDVLIMPRGDGSPRLRAIETSEQRTLRLLRQLNGFRRTQPHCAEAGQKIHGTTMKTTSLLVSRHGSQGRFVWRPLVNPFRQVGSSKRPQVMCWQVANPSYR